MKICVFSAIGEGSLFIVDIPVGVVQDAPKYHANVEKTREQVDIPDYSGRELLCVDDNNVNRMVFKGLFKGTKAKIDLAENGRKALEFHS